MQSDPSAAKRQRVDRDECRQGETVIYLLHDEAGAMLNVDTKNDQKIGSRRYSVKSIIGQPYGSVFELEHRTLKRVDGYDIIAEVSEPSAGKTRDIVACVFD